MATHSSILAWKTPWTEEPGGLQSTGSPSWTQLSGLARAPGLGNRVAIPGSGHKMAPRRGLPGIPGTAAYRRRCGASRAQGKLPVSALPPERSRSWLPGLQRERDSAPPFPLSQGEGWALRTTQTPCRRAQERAIQAPQAGPASPR